MSDVIDVSPLGTGVATFLATPSSANLAAALTDETGSGVAVFGTGPTISGATLTGATSASGASSLIVPTSGGYAPTANGSIGYDSTQTGWVAGGAGALTGYLPRALYRATPAADTLTAAATNTVEKEFATTFQIPANYLIANKALLVTYSMQYIATATVPTTTFRLRLGTVGVTGAIVYQVVSATAFTATATSRGWMFQFLIDGTAAASAGSNVNTQVIGSPIASSAAASINTIAQPLSLATNGALNLNLTIQYSTNAATNQAQLLSMTVQELY